MNFEAPMVECGTKTMEFEFQEMLTVLGCALDATGSPEAMLKHSLASAERAFWAKYRLWKSRAPRLKNSKPGRDTYIQS